jgi:allophanate hydrolase
MQGGQMIEIKRVGFYAQLVDQGRTASTHLGFSESGAADWQSYELANALVGNSMLRSDNHCKDDTELTKDDTSSLPNATSIEITLGELCLEFQQTCFIAITGADATCTINDQACDMYQGMWVKKGASLTVTDIGKTYPHFGVRVYIAIRGGLDTPQLFASAANVKREGSGGLHGNGSSLQRGDKLPFANDLSDLCIDLSEGISNSTSALKAKPILQLQQSMREQCQAPSSHIALIPSYQWNDFSASQRSKMFSSLYSTTAQADRMAIKLHGPKLKSASTTLFSQGLSKGAVQCTGDGQLIVMLNDRQTIGGYPVLGSVEAFSRAKLAQAKPGMSFSFALSDVLSVAAKLRIWRRQIENICAHVDHRLSS